MGNHDDEPRLGGAPPGPSVIPVAQPALTPNRPAGRDRYLDTLRALALGRVVAYHSFGAVWLSLVFPSMGVMFALAGSLMARSLDRPAGGVLKSRTKRLLLPLWVYAFTVLGLLFFEGWRPWQEENGSWLNIALWFIPVGNPPFPESSGTNDGLFDTSWGVQAEAILWYIRAYFWFMLLSPLLLKAFRRFPWVTLLTPLMLLIALNQEHAAPLPDWANSPVTDFLTFGSCWILGFAHRDGLLRKLRLPIVVILALVLMGLGLEWAATHLAASGWDLNEIPLAQALWSLGFCAVLMRLSPVWAALPGPLRILDGVVTLMNNRAITIYLWHNLLLAAAVLLIDLGFADPTLSEAVPWLLESDWLMFVLVWPLLGITILCVGWVEDLAAGKAPRMWPVGPEHRPSRVS